MSVLVVQIPARPHQAARAIAEANSGSAIKGEPVYRYALSADGLSVSDHGQRQAADLPKADSVVAVMHESDVSWHRPTLPKVSPAKQRALMLGTLEEALLTDPDATHLAIQPEPPFGQPVWVAALHEPWLRQHIAALEAADLELDRVVVGATPNDLTSGHFWRKDSGAEDESSAMLTWAHAGGVAVLPLEGQAARHIAQAHATDMTTWSADPDVAAHAEHWLGRTVESVLPAQRLLTNSRSSWNLRQFGLAKKSRGARVLRDGWREFLSPPWRAARWGLACLVVVQIAGMNLWAAHLNRQIKSQRAAVMAALKEGYPQVGGVVDAPAQMRKELARLRAQAGQLGENDLETLLLAAATAWPGDRPPVERLRFENQRLSLTISGWDTPQIDQFRSVLEADGWDVRLVDSQLVLGRAPGTRGTK